MRVLIWLLRGMVFVALFGLAIKNSAVVDLRLYFGSLWQAPLSLVILTSFAVGALVGATAAVATLIRQRREISRLRDELRVAELTRSRPQQERVSFLQRWSGRQALGKAADEVADISADPAQVTALSIEQSRP